VEDEPSVRDGLEALFSSQGFAVRTASDGLSALEVRALGQFDLVVLDLMLPRVPGLVARGSASSASAAKFGARVGNHERRCQAGTGRWPHICRGTIERGLEQTLLAFRGSPC